APHRSGARRQPAPAETAPGREETAPGREETAPGREETAPGREETAPGREETAPGRDKVARLGTERCGPGASARCGGCSMPGPTPWSAWPSRWDQSDRIVRASPSCVSGWVGSPISIGAIVP